MSLGESLRMANVKPAEKQPQKRQLLCNKCNKNPRHKKGNGEEYAYCQGCLHHRWNKKPAKDIPA